MRNTTSRRFFSFYWSKLLSTLLLALLGMVIGIVADVRPSLAQASTQPHFYFVDEAGQPLALAKLRILCHRQPGDPAPWLLDDQMTDVQGRLINPLPNDCLWIVALYPQTGFVHPQIHLYATHFAPSQPALAPASGAVTIDTKTTFYLVDLIVSLEWEPTAPFIDELIASLHQASGELYTATGGQAALGKVTIYTRGQAWDNADLQVRAANNKRPAAVVGGFVDAPWSVAATTYLPGAMAIGRCWDGRDGFCWQHTHNGANPILWGDMFAPNWSQTAGVHTLVHELSHYLLFLYDEYIGLDQSSGRRTFIQNCKRLSLMGDPYRRRQFILPTDPLASDCLMTDQWLAWGFRDWDMLQTYLQLQQPTAHPPATWSNVLFQVIYPPLPVSSAPAPLLKWRINHHFVHGGDLHTFDPQIYLLEQPAAGLTKILYQGTTEQTRTAPQEAGASILLGTDLSASDLYAYADLYRSATVPQGGRFTYQDTTNATLTLATPTLQRNDDLRFSLAIDYELSNNLPITMHLKITAVEPLAQPEVTLCTPDDAVGCIAIVPLQRLVNGWQATFAQASGLPHYGVLLVSAPEQGRLLRWFERLDGVGQASMHAHAPQLDGDFRVDFVAPTGTQGRALAALPAAQALVMPAADYALLNQPLPAGVRGLLGTPIDLDVVSAQSTLPPFQLTMPYDPIALTHLGVTEAQLTLLHRCPEGGWQLLPVNAWGLQHSGHGHSLHEDETAADLAYGRLISAPLVEDGIYAIGFADPTFPLPAQTQCTPPPIAPDRLHGTTVSDVQIRLTWRDRAQNETGFTIERCTATTATACASFTPIATLSANQTSFANTGLAANTRYCYRVFAFDAGANSPPTATVCRTTGPLPPTRLVARAAPSAQINLSWRDNANNEQGFKIERCMVTTGTKCINFVQLTQVAANTVVYQNQPLQSSTIYCYRLRAYNGNGNSRYSNSACISTVLMALQTAAEATAEVESIDWSDQTAEEATGLNLYLRPGEQISLQHNIACRGGATPSAADLLVNETVWPMAIEAAQPSYNAQWTLISDSFATDSSYSLQVRWRCLESSEPLTDDLGLLFVGYMAPAAEEPGADVQREIYLPLIVR